MVEQTKEYLLGRLQEWVKLMTNELVEYTKHGEIEDMEFCRGEITNGALLIGKLMLDSYSEEEYNYIQTIVADLEERNGCKYVEYRLIVRVSSDVEEIEVRDVLWDSFPDNDWNFNLIPKSQEFEKKEIEPKVLDQDL